MPQVIPDPNQIIIVQPEHPIPNQVIQPQQQLPQIHTLLHENLIIGWEIPLEQNIISNHDENNSSDYTTDEKKLEKNGELPTNNYLNDEVQLSKSTEIMLYSPVGFFKPILATAHPKNNNNVNTLQEDVKASNLINDLLLKLNTYTASRNTK